MPGATIPCNSLENSFVRSHYTMLRYHYMIMRWSFSVVKDHHILLKCKKMRKKLEVSVFFLTFAEYLETTIN